MFFGNRRTYTLIGGDEEEAGDPGQNSDDETNQGAPPMSHEIVNVSFEGIEQNSELVSSSKRNRRWDHIEDIDQFFTLVYEYHQGNGLICIALRHAFALFQFLFIICFSTFLLQCVDYDVLFANRNTTTTGQPVLRKRHISDAIIPYYVVSFNPLIVIAIMLAAVFWLAHLLRVGYRLIQLWEMKTFYYNVLNIEDDDLANVPWQSVVQRLCKFQPELHFVINKEEITTLDVYQRILRYKNYFVALVYDDLLPPQINFPLVGSVPYLSSGLRLNLEWLFFWGPMAPWKDAYTLKDEYRDPKLQHQLTDKMRQTIAWMSLVNLVFFPFIFLYQVLFSFFSNADLIKRDPGVFGTRKYSNYGREKLRHFNELDHELHSRLNKSYGFAVRYMNQFASPKSEIIAKAVAFTFGSVLAVLASLSAWDEDVLNIEHMLTAVTVCGAVVLACRSFIPQENMVFCQQFLMRQIVANIHYAPKTWLKEAHSTEVNKEFSQLFQLKAQYLVEEVLSPLLTPFVLYFHIRPRASDIVKFFQTHTQNVDGLGDVCSYSMMDITRDGDLRLAPLNQSVVDNSLNNSYKTSGRAPSCGKIELSLLNFATLNPNWRPSAISADFIRNVRDLVAQEMATAPLTGDQLPLQCSLDELETSIRTNSHPAQHIVNRMAASHIQPPPGSNQDQGDEDEGSPPTSFMATSTSAGLRPRSVAGSQERYSAPVADGVPGSMAGSMMMAASQGGSTHPGDFIHPYPLGALVQPRNVQENSARATEMSFNALALNRMLMSSFSLATGGGPPQSLQSMIYNQKRAPGGLLHQQPQGPHYGSVVSGSIAASNLWGVPEMSQIVSSMTTSPSHPPTRQSDRRRNGHEDVGHDHNDPMTP